MKSLIELAKETPRLPGGSYSEYATEPYRGELEAFFKAVRTGEVGFDRQWAWLFRLMKQRFPELQSKSPEGLRQYVVNHHPDWLEGLPGRR